MLLLGLILNIIHLVMLFSPIWLFLIPLLLIKNYSNAFKIYLLIMLLVPIHWVFFDGKCIFTMLTRKTGALGNTKTKSRFSEVYLKWLYKPIMNIIGWKWDNKGLGKMVSLHWVLNFILLWYFAFYYARKQLC